jgi:undecaprenyl diphosphate synthase
MSDLPAHIAIIMDGNGRWAQRRGLTRGEGHKAGVRAAENIVSTCRKLGIPFLTLYTFSQENWGRPKEEISQIFGLLADFLRIKLPDMLQNSIRLNVFGEIRQLPLASRTALRHAIKKTASCAGMTLNLALNYSGRDEIVRAAQKIVAQNIPPGRIHEDLLRKYLSSTDQPDPDLIIRTSGECRLSNFLVFQSVYSELYFTDTLWPDFDEEQLHIALTDFKGRSRRFGLVQP